MNKEELRNTFLDIRKKVSNKNEKNSIILEKVLENEKYKLSNTIGIYASLNDEVDTMKLIEMSINLGKIVLCPRVINKKNMSFYVIKSLDELSLGTFKIKEPPDICENILLSQDIDLFIVPGICFDKNKNRLGYGGGYYDRYLENNSSYKIGLAYFEQILNDNSIPCNDTDIKIDEVITDKVLIK